MNWPRRTLLTFAIGAAVATLGCNRGGVELTGDRHVLAPEVPRDAAAWLNGAAHLDKLRGQVVLIEAWHPS